MLAPKELPNRREIVDSFLSGIGTHCICPKRLIQPLFLVDSPTTAIPSSTIPDAHYLTVANVSLYADKLLARGIRNLLLFALPTVRDRFATESYSPTSPVVLAARVLREKYPQINLVADLCVCHYTREAHCRIVVDGKFDMEATQEALIKQALLYAEAGIDMIMPSGMMPNIIRSLRDTLDNAGFYEVALANQSAKFSSTLYKPMQQSTFHGGHTKDKSEYQLSVSESRGAISKIEEDIKDGADMVIIKPALGFQDIFKHTKEKTSTPLVAFMASGEHVLLEQVAKLKNIPRQKILHSSYRSLIISGADLIVTYSASSFAKSLVAHGPQHL